MNIAKFHLFHEKYIDFNRTSVAIVDLQVSQWFELVVFTASMEIYGTAVADKLDGNQGMLNRRYLLPVPLSV